MGQQSSLSSMGLTIGYKDICYTIIISARGILQKGLQSRNLQT